MPNKSFLIHLKSQIGTEDSALRSNIAKTVLRQKDSMQAATLIISEISDLAKKQGASDLFELMEDPSGNMLSNISNAIYYNRNSVTIAPNQPNRASKSPKYIADKVLEDMADILRREVDGE